MNVSVPLNIQPNINGSMSYVNLTGTPPYGSLCVVCVCLCCCQPCCCAIDADVLLIDATDKDYYLSFYAKSKTVHARYRIDKAGEYCGVPGG